MDILSIFRSSIFVVLSCILFPAHQGYAQAQNLDSLKNAFRENPNIQTAIQISKGYFSNNVDSATHYAKAAYDLLSKHTDDSTKGRVIGHYGLSLVESSRYNEAERFLTEALKIQENAEHPDLEGLSTTYNALGNLNFYRKNPLKTIQWYQKSLDIDQKIGDKARLAKAYGNLGLIYRAIRMDREAIKSYRASLKLLRELGDQASEIRVLVNMTYAYGNSDFELHNLDSAIYYGRKALALGEALNFTFGIAKAQAVLCSALIRKGQDSNTAYLSEGLQMATAARKFFEKSAFKAGYYDALLNEGFAYEALGQPLKAIEIAEKVKEAGFAVYECDRLLAMSFKQLGLYEKAISYFESYHNVLDSIRLRDQRRKLAEFQLGFETEKIKAEKAEAENQAKEAEAESERNRMLFIGAAAVAVLIIMTAGFYISRQKQAKKAELALQQMRATQKQLALEKQYRDSELKALKAQMSPHFIFNVLNSIQEYIVTNNKERASDYLAMFAELIRSYLDQSGKKSISVQNEIETLDRYLKLEALRFGNEFSFQIEVDDSIDTEVIKIPPMIIQPYVENAIKHGLFNKEGAKALRLTFKLINPDVIQCIVEDNGIGRAAAAKNKATNPLQHESFAMKATLSRAELYNQQSTKKITIEVTDLYDDSGKATGTRVAITIPIQKEN